MADLLLIDDDPDLLTEKVSHLFPAPAHRIQIAHSGEEGLRRLEGSLPEVILLDMRLPDQSGMDVLRRIREIDDRIPVVLVTLPRSADAAIEAMRQGAYDCLFEPLDPQKLGRVIHEALNAARSMRSQTVFAETHSDDDLQCETIVGCCGAMQEVYKAIGRVADQTFPVLITGESGTGKELVARAIFEHGPRANAPFLALNCAAIPEQLLESELFGHEKGAFTGADRRRIGKFEQCHGGTIFLDEIGDMPPSTQAKVLRLLQQQKFERVGGDETIQTDVRLIAATNRDLKTLSADNTFRLDLYYRVGVFSIHLPPLRERKDDLPLLVRHFLRRFSQEMHREVREVSPATLECFQNHSWPGNIRELQSVLKQAILQCNGTVLLPNFLPELVKGNGEASVLSEPVKDCGAEAFVLRQRITSDVRDLYTESHRQLDRLLLPRVLEHACGSLQESALLLGIARQTLRMKLRELGLSGARSAAVD